MSSTTGDAPEGPAISWPSTEAEINERVQAVIQATEVTLDKVVSPPHATFVTCLIAWVDA